ncbi:hypothetical protein ONZ45_g11074 [Pleurotus djamor]|nr:hypothetical protein ONZ45_g11074 [Pleurotus djamor]
MVPQPTKALILVFPLTGEIKEKHAEEDKKLRSEGGFPVDPTVLWIKQTISNACGTMALIHSIANSDVGFAPQSPLTKFIEQAMEMSPEQRAHLLETTTLFSNIHAASASEGQSTVTDEVMNTDMHFTAFIVAPEPDLREKASTGQGENAAGAAGGTGKESTGMRLVELDGTRIGPIDRGECNDFLKDAAKYIRENYIASSSSVQFSILALGPPA